MHNDTQQTICGFDVDKQSGVISADQDLSDHLPDCFRIADDPGDAGRP
jgi:hypothetical protein